MASLSEWDAAAVRLQEAAAGAGALSPLVMAGAVVLLAAALAAVWLYAAADLLPRGGDIRPRKRRLLRRASMRAKLERPPVCVGHRGMGSTAAAGVEENTVESFAMALDGGADGIETDVHLTRDGVFVLYHDDVLAGRAVHDYLFEEIRRVPLGPRGKYRVPTLYELLSMARKRGRSHDKFRTVLELKGGEFKKRGNVQLLFNFLAVHDFMPYVAVMSSFNHESLRHATEIMQMPPAPGAPSTDHVHIGALFNRSNTPLQAEYLEDARRCGADEIHLRANHATREIVDRAVAERLEVMIYFSAAVETPEQIDAVLRLGPGLSVVCTNMPRLLRRRLRQLAGEISESEFSSS